MNRRTTVFLWILIFALLPVIPLSAAIRQAAKGDIDGWDLNGTALPGVAVYMDGTDAYWGDDSGTDTDDTAHLVQIVAQVGAGFMKGLNGSGTITFTPFLGSNTTTARKLYSHTESYTIGETTIRWCSKPISMTPEEDNLQLKIHSDNASDTGVNIEVTVMETASINKPTHIWYVAKTGDDENEGHTYDDALLTIGQAVTSAASGDKIIIYPGEYDETVDLHTANEGLWLYGTNRSNCKIKPASGNGIEIGDYNRIENLWIKGNTYGVITPDGVLDSANGVQIINCYIYGNDIGLCLEGGTDAGFVKDTTVESTLNPLKTQVRDMVYVDCQFKIDDPNAVTSTDHVICLEPNTTTFVRCFFRENRNTASVTADIYGIKCIDGQYNINVVACTFKLRMTGGSSTGTIYGIHVPGTTMGVNVANTMLFSQHTADDTKRYDLYMDDSEGKLAIGNVFYETSSGPIMGLEKETLKNLNTEMDRY